MKSIAVVIPWFGPNLTGGAERQAFQIATRLASRGHRVEVLATCCESFASDWAVNYHSPGQSDEFGLTVRRFLVDSRDAAAFDRVNAKLLQLQESQLRPGQGPVSTDESSIFVTENIKSSALLSYLENNRESFDAFIFLPYMFQPSTSGVLLVGDRAWLQPCLHNEPAAYLPEVAEMFRQAGRILFNSNGEREFALELFGPGIFRRSQIVGEGIEPVGDSHELPDELLEKKFLLYLGRRESVKNLPLLLRAFGLFRDRYPSSSLHLVLAGAGPETISMRGVVDLGVVSEDLKAALLRSATALVQPSTNESFSRVMMEAWSVGRPVVVNSECRPTAGPVLESGGGWVASCEDEWVKAFELIEQYSARQLEEVGERGRRYADQNASWDLVIDRYEKLLDSDKARPSQPKGLRAIHQLLPDMVYGDAISNHALAIRNCLRRQGYESEIFVKRCEERLRHNASLLDEQQPANDAGLFYHHSIGSEVTATAVSHPGPKCLIYHNITPAHYFAPYRPGFAWMLEIGRASLKRLVKHFRCAVGDSAYNAVELTLNGFEDAGVLPIIIDPDRWNIDHDQDQLRRLQDGRTNILFTGRLAPNKKQDRLVEAFSLFRKFDPGARLVLAGAHQSSDPYFQYVLEKIRDLKLESSVEVTGSVEDETLLAYYRVAHLYWSFSEHEGFGAPLIEAMWFDIPVFALSSSAVTETMNGSSELFDSSDDLEAIATRAFQLVSDAKLREPLIEWQRSRREIFMSAAVAPILVELVEKLEAQLAATSVA